MKNVKPALRKDTPASMTNSDDFLDDFFSDEPVSIDTIFMDHFRKSLLEYASTELDNPLCEHCKQFHPGLEKAPVRTMYATGAQPQPLLCPDCTEEWMEYWDGMWKDYYGGLM